MLVRSSRDQVLAFGYVRIDCIWCLFFSKFSSLIQCRKSIQLKSLRQTQFDELVDIFGIFSQISNEKLREFEFCFLC